MMWSVRSKLLQLSIFLCLLAGPGCDNSQEDDRRTTSIAVVGACDVQRGCQAGDAEFSAQVRFDALPRALKAFPVSVRTAGKRSVESVMVTFFMEGMDMGLNRYRMLGDAVNGWHADVALPICVSGRSDWIAEFEFVIPDRRILLRVPFALER
jgi:hypothetical protein